MLVTVRDRVQKQKSAGKKVEEVVAAKPTAEFDASLGHAVSCSPTFSWRSSTALCKCGTQRRVWRRLQADTESGQNSGTGCENSTATCARPPYGDPRRDTRPSCSCCVSGLIENERLSERDRRGQQHQRAVGAYGNGEGFFSEGLFLGGFSANDQRHVQEPSWAASSFQLSGGRHFAAEYT